MDGNVGTTLSYPVILKEEYRDFDSEARSSEEDSVPLCLPPGTIVRPLSDDFLEKTLSSHEPTMKNLILAAIGVMKNRKARPDIKRISNWIYNRYGKTNISVSEELNRMVSRGELIRVDYKGSISYRVNSSDSKNSRKLLSLLRSTLKNEDRVGDGYPNSKPSSRILSTDVSLRTLVRDVIGSSIEGATVNIDFIKKAIATSKRPINISSLLSNFDDILAKEVSVGNFEQRNKDSYTLTSPTISSPSSVLSPETVLLHNTNYVPSVSQTLSATPPLPSYTKMTFITNPSTVHLKNISGKTEEEKKNELIQEKLIQFKGGFKGAFDKSPSKKNVPLFQTLRNKRSRGSFKKLGNLPGVKNPLEASSSSSLSLGSKKQVGRPKKSKVEQNDSEVEEEEEEIEEENGESRLRENRESGVKGSIRSSRKKKSRKIFDPADHETPSRKTRKNTPEDTCIYCENTGSLSKNKKGQLESLLKCDICSNGVHLRCLDYTEELIQKIRKGPWNCINCRTCSTCKENKEEYTLLFCDGCDLAYHMECCDPKIESQPTGKWNCKSCHQSISQESNSLASVESTNGKSHVEDKETTDETPELISQFSTLLPPIVYPHTGILAKNWNEIPIDPSIPDVSNWSSLQVKNYFIQQGFHEKVSHVFLDQELDGKSLLLLQRSDVTSSLALKLGPALKIYNLIKRLQTRRTIFS